MASSLKFKGFNYTSYYNGNFGNADSLPDLVATGANSAAITTDYAINVNTSQVYADRRTAGDPNDPDGTTPGATDTDTDVANTIKEAVSAGLTVMVRPLIDFTDTSVIGTYGVGEFRSYYNPAEGKSGAAATAATDAFFASYKTMILSQASLAAANGAQILCIGAEIDQLCGPAYLSKWTDIISAVKAVFKGQLTYSADWNTDTSPWAGHHGLTNGTGDLTTQISFWNQLDYVGVDLYARVSDVIPTTSAQNPSVSDLTAAWTQTPPTDAADHATTGNKSLIQYFQDAAKTLGKPLMFTEAGYTNATDAAAQPEGSSTNVVDDALQASLYQAFFNAWGTSGDGTLQGVYFYNWDPNASEVGPGQGVNFSVQGLPAQNVVKAAFAACYGAGTRVTTPTGYAVIESLRPGDAVLTARGEVRRIIWTGHREVDVAAHPTPDRIRPVRVRADAFGEGRPARDLILSPDHCVYAQGALIPIRCLLNETTIVQDAVETIRYWHIELQDHDIVMAEGLMSETYRDTGNRHMFAGGRVVALHPDFCAAPSNAAWTTAPCAPVIEAGPGLDRVIAELGRRARSLGYAAPKMRDVALVAPGTTRVDVGAGVARVRLRSPATTTHADRRRLGALISGLRLDGRPIALDRPCLARGFHDVEDHDGTTVRWTDGEAVIRLTSPVGWIEVDVAALAAEASVRPAA